VNCVEHGDECDEPPERSLVVWEGHVVRERLRHRDSTLSDQISQVSGKRGIAGRLAMKRVRNWTISHQYFVVPGGPNWTHSANHEGSDACIECRHVCGELELRETRVGGRRELERGTGASAGRVLALNE
jgi:hypothetical protein